MKLQKIRKLPRCKHLHVSGRRCGMGTTDKSGLCTVHRASKICPECESMRLSFVPAKGW